MNQQPTHGGRRPGAGRKPSGRTAYTIRMKPAAMKKLRAKAYPKALGAWLEQMVKPERNMTTETKHTPGPWLVSGFDIYGPALHWDNQPHASPSTIVASCGECAPDAGNYRHYPTHIAEANRRLIAAAPELLLALQQISHNAEARWWNMDKADLQSFDAFKDIHEKAVAAIAKATVT